MKLYITYTSPYARLARILVLEKGLSESVEIIEAKTRMVDSPYYRIIPTARNCDSLGIPKSVKL
jgi:glutathione S-transferase